MKLLFGLLLMCAKHCSIMVKTGGAEIKKPRITKKQPRTQLQFAKDLVMR